jgi:glycosyltransferase involved in cell wall biosynthesis
MITSVRRSLRHRLRDSRALSADTRDLRLSLVVPMFEVEEYLPDFLTSLTQQRPGAYALEVVFVDDGSPDRCAALATRWLNDSSHVTGRVIQQRNQGVSAARERGLAAATGDWVSFPDPDDALDRRYLAQFADFLAAHGDEMDAATSYIVRWDEAGGRLRDVHPLRERFARGSRVVRMDDEPDVFLMNVATAFFPRIELQASGASFASGLHASEDALFVADYFLSLDHPPRLGLNAKTRYFYRKRRAATSAVDRYQERVDSYIERFRDGYLPRLRGADSLAGVPRWFQHMLVYEYRWLYAPQASAAGYAYRLSENERAQVLAITKACLQFVDVDAINSYAATELGVEVRALLLAFKDALSYEEPPYVTRTRAGEAEYRWLRPAAAASPIPRAFPSTSRRPDYFGQTALTEWVAWLPESVGLGDAVRVPQGRTLSTWSGRKLPPASTVWRMQRLLRRARATWASRIGLLQVEASVRSRLWVFESPPGDSALVTLASAARERGHGVVTVHASPAGRAASRSRRHVLAMLRARVVVCVAERAELTARSHPQGAPRRWLGVAIAASPINAQGYAGLEFSQFDLVVATNATLAATITAPDSGCGFVADDVAVAADRHEVISLIERRLAGRVPRTTHPRSKL